jgi:Fic family protein
MSKYIYQYKEWPEFRWDSSLILPLLGEVRNLQGRVTGRMESLGFQMRDKATLDSLTLEITKSTEIEGEFLDADQVRSSIARRLGMDIAGSVPSDRNVDGIVDMMMDATQNYSGRISDDRLFGWHSALFPSGRSGMHKIDVGRWRTDSAGPMQIVSGAVGREKIHYQAPDAKVVPEEMNRFIDWFNTDQGLDTVLKAGVAHIWFVTVHPFEDGNGRIARALTEMFLSRSDNSSQRFYSMSSQIRAIRNSYYEILESTQKGEPDITDWLYWFLNCLKKAIESSGSLLSNVLSKAEFWKLHATTVFNERQVLMLNKLLEGFEGKLSSSKWAKITHCSADTALRDIQDLISRNVLRKESAGGRSTHYELVKF